MKASSPDHRVYNNELCSNKKTRSQVVMRRHFSTRRNHEMPSVRTILADILECMCCNNGEVYPDGYFGRGNFEMPYRPPYRPPARSSRSPVPHVIPRRPEQRNNQSPNASGPPTVLLVPGNIPQQESTLRDPHSKDSFETFVVAPPFGGPNSLNANFPSERLDDQRESLDELPPTPTPQAKQRPVQRQVPPFQKRDPVNRRMSRPEETRVALSSQEVGSVGVAGVEESAGGHATQTVKSDGSPNQEIQPAKEV